MPDIFDQVASQQAPTGADAPRNANLPIGVVPAQKNAIQENGVPGPSPAAAPAGGGDLFDRVAANPGIAAPPPPGKEPGGFGPFDESESHLFTSPVHKGVHEGIALGLGLKSPSEGFGDALADTWDNLVSGAQASYQRIHEAMGGEGESGVSGAVGTAIDVGLTPLDMLASGVEGTASLFEKGSKELWAGRQALAKGGSAEAQQQFGRGVGMILSALGQLALSDETGKLGERVGAKVGAAAEKAAPGPGNALLRARKANFGFGKNPGDYFVDEPVKPPVATTRLGQLENIRAQNVAHGEALHTGVNDLLRNADTVQAITPQGAITRVPNLLDWAPEVEDAAEEVKRDLQKQGGVANRKAVAKAVDAARDDLLQEHDLQGNPTGARARQAVPTEVNEIKKSVGGRGNYKVFTDPDAAEIAAVKDRFFKKAYGKLNTLVDDAVGGAPGKRVRDLNRRYANAIEARDLLDNEIAKEKGTGGLNNMRRKLEWGAAAGGLASGNPVAMFLGALEALNRVGRSIPGRVMTARALKTGGQALQSPAGRATAGAAGAVVGAIPAVSGAARRMLGGEEVQP